MDVEHICKYYNVHVIKCSNINDNETIEWLRGRDLDLVVSVAAPQIFKAVVLGIPKRGCINIHNSKLPKYRGMLPSFWVLYHNEQSSAVTIHTMDLDIDRGKILLQREFEVKVDESVDQVIKRSKALGALCLIEVLKGIKEGTVEYKEADQTEASYFSFPTAEDVKEFRCMGKRLL